MPEAAPGYEMVTSASNHLLTGSGRTVSSARLRHKLVAKAVVAFERAMKLASAGEWRLGALELQKAVALDTGFSEAHGNLGAHYLMLGRLDDAASELRNAIALDPASSIHHTNLAIALLMLERQGDAMLEAKTAVNLDGSNIAANYLFGILLARTSERREAAIPYLAYASRSLPEAHLALSTIYRKAGEADLAELEMERYKASPRKNRTAGPAAGQ